MPNPTHGGHQGPPPSAPIAPRLLALAMLERGLTFFPCNGKRPIVKWTLYQTTPPTSQEVQRWWPSMTLTSNLAILCGKHNNLTVIDVDGCGHAPETRTSLLELFGYTPIVVETPGKGGGYQLYYLHNGERNGEWEEAGFHGDFRGEGGYVMAPGSLHPEAHQHYLLQGGLDAFLTGLDNLSVPKHKPPIKNTKKADTTPNVGNRNNTLFSKSLAYAKSLNTEVALLDAALAFNNTFPEPLGMEEVQQVVKSAWGYKARGKIYDGAGEQEARFALNEWERLHEDEFYLLGMLRFYHQGRDSFYIKQAAIKEKLMWGQLKLRRAINGLITTGFIHLKRQGGATKGDPSEYGWGSGSK